MWLYYDPPIFKNTLPTPTITLTLLTRTFEMSHVGGATRRMTPIPRNTLEKNRMTYPSSKATLWVKAQT